MGRFDSIDMALLAEFGEAGLYLSRVRGLAQTNTDTHEVGDLSFERGAWEGGELWDLWDEAERLTTRRQDSEVMVRGGLFRATILLEHPTNCNQGRAFEKLQIGILFSIRRRGKSHFFGQRFQGLMLNPLTLQQVPQSPTR